ncbi:hypothetical protein JI58_03480 [Marinosulfonomonas sp. PRT-SC04]|nr:hypothetical protein JI58_06525 [Marinosulfonomonas sp. PRT-SC04]KPU83981.1 hypothetical protein JI58_06380 [Marinosulfonomonas sp. PRT-SC04]KPU84054.1 hypothetical protein JI58_06135 [Marinosulfonomonas sp. PRT-SC04]KPU84236.1 hypothetical protein JI58_04940 [Marinosulfonomonas sp. PRT-SC04]KPU84319.1 hypothetical protein JI58_04535 [Marinosulfonomonas sp. PRT-SC04]
MPPFKAISNREGTGETGLYSAAGSGAASFDTVMGKNTASSPATSATGGENRVSFSQLKIWLPLIA